MTTKKTQNRGKAFGPIVEIDLYIPPTETGFTPWVSVWRMTAETESLTTVTENRTEYAALTKRAIACIVRNATEKIDGADTPSGATIYRIERNGARLDQ